MMSQIKQLREQTGVGIMECKKALNETGGDIEKAKEVLRKAGKELANKKSSRDASQGIVESYIHPNKKMGVLLEIRCETDFVAKSEDFKSLAHEICLQIAAMKSSYVSEEDIPESFLAKEKEIYKEQFKKSGKPEEVIDGIVEGKLNKCKKEISLLSQPWIKDESKTIKNLIEEMVAKIGENIKIKKFIRYEI